MAVPPSAAAIQTPKSPSYQNTSMDKAALRAHYLAIRAGASESAGPHAWKSFWAQLQSLPNFGSFETILLYHSKDSESPTHEIIAELLAHHRRVALPCADAKTKTMQARRIETLAELAPAPFGLLEPVAGRCPRIPPGKIDLIVVPLLAFDESGHRLGYGHGFYDRYLKTAQCTKVGLAYEAQMCGKLPHEAHDVPLDYIVTEKRIIACRHD